MDGGNGRLMSWRFSIVETIGFGFSLASIAVGITLWSMSTFQSKEEAASVKLNLEQRVIALEGEMRELRASMQNVARDVAYIRGVLEPKAGRRE